uniref:Uncharacterized protein n=1 Tax=Cacopsylla melanoneura TaxID=428564 RepID=A0A8D8UK15_9HEMI
MAVWKFSTILQSTVASTRRLRSVCVMRNICLSVPWTLHRRHLTKSSSTLSYLKIRTRTCRVTSYQMQPRRGTTYSSLLPWSRKWNLVPLTNGNGTNHVPIVSLRKDNLNTNETKTCP